MKRKLLALILASAMMIAMTACGGEESPPAQTTPTTTVVQTTPTTVPTSPADPTPVGERNMLTGRYDMAQSDLTRPVGIMVANNDFLQGGKQVGIGSADMWVESETEGGITRIMAVFANTARVPSAIGPVRSARSPFFHIVEEFGFAYCHAGGSPPALANIAASNIADLDVNNGDASYSWRDNEFPYDYEYRLRTSGDRLTKYLTDKGYKTQAVKTVPWTFGAQTGASATTVSVKMSGAQTIGFEYDAAAGVYYKTNGSSKTRHVDSSGTAITPTSVLVMYSDKVAESDETFDYTLFSGKGYVFSAGVMRRFNWTRDANGFTMTEEDGTQLTLAEGKVYLCLASTGVESALSYQ